MVLGIRPSLMADVDGQTIIEFSQEISVEQESQLNQILAAGDPERPPLGTCRFRIGDLAEHMEILNSAAGTRLWIYYAESVPGSGKFDIIELHSERPLSSAEAGGVIYRYQSLIRTVRDDG